MNDDDVIRVLPAAAASDARTYAGPAGQAWRTLEHGTYAATNAAGEDLRLEVAPSNSSASCWPAGINPRDYLGPRAGEVAARDGWQAREWEAYATAKASREAGNRPITLYTSEDCQACRMTKRALDKIGVDYRLINIADVPTATLEAMRDQGHAQLPVVDTGTQRWSGLRPDKIKGIEETGRE